MTLRGRTALQNQIDTLFASAKPAGISAEDGREMFQDIMDSFAPQAVDMTLSTDDQNVSVTATPTLYNGPYQANTPANTIFTPDPANGRIRATRSCFCLVTFRMIGEWAAVEDLVIEIYANGAPHPTTPKSIVQEGPGSNDPFAISFTRLGFPVFASMLVGGFCDIEVYFSSLTGNFTLDIEQLELAAEYTALTADEI